ncbi:oligosaccharide flippase family protein [Vibrio cholerae]|nr:oligosaccharide flippase family protein [Vibrio cholerae]
MSIIKSSLSYSISNMIIKFGGVIILPLVTSLLSPSEFGRIGLIVTFSSILTVVLVMGLYVPQNNVQSGKLKESVYLPSQLILWAINIAVIYMVFCVFLDYEIVASYLDKNEISQEQMRICYVISIFSSLNIIISSYFKMNRRYYFVSVVSIFNFIFFYVFAFLLIGFFDLSVNGYLWSYVFSQVILFLIQGGAYFANFSVGFNFKSIAYAIKNGLPVMLIELVGRLNETLDRIILSRFINTSDMGIYILASTGGKVISVFSSSFVNSIYPQIYESKSNAIKILELFYFPLSACVVLAQVLAMYSFHYFFSSDYNQLPLYFAMLLPVFSLQYLYYIDHIYHAKEKSKYVTCISIAILIVNSIISIIIIPILGYIGAVISGIICSIVRYSTLSIIAHKIFRIRVKAFYIIMPTFFQISYPFLIYLDVNSSIVDIVFLTLSLLMIIFSFGGLKKLLFSKLPDKEVVS